VNLCDLCGGALLKLVRFLPILVTAALFSSASWADGIDPKVIPLGGTGSTPITITNPNPVVTAMAVGPNAANLFCLGAVACVDDVFQNQTGKTLTSLTMFFSSKDNPGLIFSCGDMTKALFFDLCTASSVTGGEDVSFLADGMNGFKGVLPAVQECEEEEECRFVRGEFGIDIYGDLKVGDSVTTQAITSPEPGAGLMVLFGALAFALFKLLRRGV
jgi:hypothetical protein